MPYALMAIVVGLALGLAGAEMQTILNNPLASPFTLGVSSAAAFGAALAIVLGIGIPGIPGQWFVSANAFIFALLAALLLDGITRWTQVATSGVILFGIALVFTFNALVSMLQFVANEDTLQGLVFWTMGSIDRASWQKVGILLAILAVVMPLSMRSAWKLTALRLGEDRAVSFGINVRRLRLTTLLRISVLSAISVAFVGPIGFIGLVAPHIARLVFGEDHRFYLPASALIGALVLSLASVAGKKPDSRRSDSGGHRHLAGGGAFFPEHYFAPSGGTYEPCCIRTGADPFQRRLSQTSGDPRPDGTAAAAR
ncbi:iron(III) dicitrate transport system permease protein FecD [Klebsiella michiganensis]|uniref:Iron(III) dicitrate transport system permease protein FecD n=1 Tax=Klebsiella michiganensis TaxID=1134687 RepID=A0A7H4N5I3_9ENTR|nr:iron(III) dicitrate transport system permease protein FecD [Klebsiella michiganensis]